MLYTCATLLAHVPKSEPSTSVKEAYVSSKEPIFCKYVAHVTQLTSISDLVYTYIRKKALEFCTRALCFAFDVPCDLLAL